MKNSVLFLVMFNLLNLTQAQDKWDINKPLEPFKNVTISTDEGTWMNLDVSPDGSQIVFDMLGDIYLMPISGGEAKLQRQLSAQLAQEETCLLDKWLKKDDPFNPWAFDIYSSPSKKSTLKPDWSSDLHRQQIHSHCRDE